LNQQQLQFARAALWHQTADTRLVTFDDAARWLDDIGLCLFLPRHTQLPAPAPSFVEACSGAPAVTPPPAAIASATELAIRLIDERRAIPLNLLGAASEQPDFLVTPEILPWAAAVRGDRQWKTAPGGRTAPIVLRTWEALDREGEMTAVQIQDRLGRELTEAAVLRALIELWTNLRAMPIYTSGQLTRWTLLKNRCPEQLATAANTAQSTALSVLLSIYLRSAVAATAEEAEIFLSPLTARSRIREVIHGMMAARQFNTMSVASQTLLFIEGSLPENLPAAEPEKETAPAAAPTPRAPFRKAPRPTRWELPARGARPEHDRRPPWQKKPVAPHRPEPLAEPSADQPGSEAKLLSPRPDSRPSRPDSKPSFAGRPNRPGTKARFGARPDSRPSRPSSGSSRPSSRPSFGARPDRPGNKPRFGSRPDSRPSRPSFGPRPDRPGSKPWQTRPNTPFRKPAAAFRKPDAGAPTRSQPGEGRPPREQPWRRKDSASSQPRTNRPWQKDRPRSDQRPRPEQRPNRDARPGESRPSLSPKSPRLAGSFAPGSAGKVGAKPSPRFSPRPGGKFSGKPAGKFTGKPGPKFGSKPGGKFGSKFGAKPGAKPRSASPRSSSPKSGAGARPFRPGNFAPRKPNSPAARGPRTGKPKNKFGNPPPRGQNPRKNRSQEEKPE
jgi:23S rRNA pseudouridine2605 synthase